MPTGRTIGEPDDAATAGSLKMGRDYFAVLDLNYSATDADIGRAFRKLALKWHPERRPTSEASSSASSSRFDDICEAYVVLSDPASRATFMVHGEAILKKGFPDGRGGFINGLTKKASSEQIFAKFFGSNNSFLVESVDLSATNAAGFAKTALPTTAAPIHSTLLITLEDVFAGCVRTLWVMCRRLHTNKHTTTDQPISVKVPIHRGIAAGTKFVFRRAGHETPNAPNGDVIVEVQIAPHPSYRRVGADLIVRRALPIGEALTAASVEVDTLDGRTLRIGLGHIVRPGTMTKVPGEGFETSDGNRGDLYIEFDLTYPSSIPLDKKQELRRLMPVS